MTTAYISDEDRARYADDDGPELEGLYIARDRHDAIDLLVNEACVKAAMALMEAFWEVIAYVQGSEDMQESILNLTCEPKTDVKNLQKALDDIQKGIRDSRECYFLEGLPDIYARLKVQMNKVATLADEAQQEARK